MTPSLRPQPWHLSLEIEVALTSTISILFCSFPQILDLRTSGQIIWDHTPARGGQVIDTIQPADQNRRTTKIEVAAARKRLLFARYNGWAQGSKRYPLGLLGRAGETAVRAAILRSGSLQPARPDAGEIGHLLGVELPGTVDSAGYMIPFAPGGLPGAPITILIEVKNIRSWIYPRTEELYQGLHKASILQVTRPEQQIVPILVCRKAHPTTFWMASQLGFMVIEMGRQFVDAAVAEEDLMEVRNELHFQDLYRVDGPSTRVLDRFQRTLPAHARRFAAIWRDTCSAPEFVALFEALRYTDDDNTRTDLTNRLRQAAAEHGKDGGW